MGRKLSAACLLLSLSTTACLTTTASVQPTGEPLDIKMDHWVEPAYIDSRGRIHPPEDRYRLEGLYQGSQKLDDELDFYHVAGDEMREKRIIEWRTARNNATMAAYGIGAVGATLALSGLGLMGYLQYQNPDGAWYPTPLGYTSMGLLAGGFILASAGWYPADMLLGPKTETQSEGDYDLVLSLQEAFKVEEEYNAKLSGGAPAEEPTPEEPAPEEAAAEEAASE